MNNSSENDARQQPGQALGRLWNDGQRDCDLFWQNRDPHHQQDDSRTKLHLWWESYICCTKLHLWWEIYICDGIFLSWNVRNCNAINPPINLRQVLVEIVRKIVNKFLQENTTESLQEWTNCLPKWRTSSSPPLLSTPVTRPWLRFVRLFQFLHSHSCCDSNITSSSSVCCFVYRWVNQSIHNK